MASLHMAGTMFGPTRVAASDVNNGPSACPAFDHANKARLVPDWDYADVD